MFHIRSNTLISEIPKVLSSIPFGETIILPINARLGFIKGVVKEIRTDCSLKLTCGLNLEQIECILKNLKKRNSFNFK